MEPPPRSAARALAGGNRDSVGTSYSDREGAGAGAPYASRRPIRGTERDRVVEREREMDRRLYSEPETSSSRRTARDGGGMGGEMRSPTSPDDSTSPRALQAAIAALQSAGASRRAKRQATMDGGISPGSAGFSPGGFGNFEEMEREEAERIRREQARADAQRRERMAARQMNGTGRPRARGDIDGTYLGGTSPLWIGALPLEKHRANRFLFFFFLEAVLDQIQGEWEWVARPDVHPSLSPLVRTFGLPFVLV